MQDADLLRDYLKNHSEAAFAELVKRYINLVYSTARRQLGNSNLADDVVQTVFCLLARKAAALTGQSTLAGWLYRATCFTAAKAQRSESRRRQHESEAIEVNQHDSKSEEIWEHLSPMLDEALHELSERDRLAVLLRFFQRKPMLEVGEALGVSEPAAKMRVSRAVEQLRKFFVHRGKTCSSAMLIALLWEKAAAAAPVSTASKITAAVLSRAAVPTISGLSFIETFILMAKIKSKTWLASTIVALAVFTAGLGIHELTMRRAPKLETTGTPARMTNEPGLSAGVARKMTSPQDLIDLAELISNLRKALWEPRAPDDHQFSSDATYVAIGRFGEHREAAFAVLKEAVADTNRLVYARALIGMEFLGKAVPEVVPFLWEVANSGDTDRGQLALISLSNIGLESADIPALAALIPVFEGGLIYTIETIIEEDPAGAKPYLYSIEQMLDNDNADARFYAACALAKHEGGENTKILRELATGISDQVGQYRFGRCLEAITKIGPAANTLLPALVDLANSWDGSSYKDSGAIKQEHTDYDRLLRTIVAVDSELQKQMPELVEADEQCKKWENKIRAGEYTLQDLVAALESPRLTHSAASQLKVMGPAATEALPSLLASLSTTYDFENKNEIVAAIETISPQTIISRADSKVVIGGILAAEQTMRSRPKSEQNPSLVKEMIRRRFGLRNQFTWYTHEELSQLSSKLALEDNEAYQAFAAKILKSDPSLNQAIQPVSSK